jgi:uncharacterized surface protein with fasciclin (FAS1) repeats
MNTLTKTTTKIAFALSILTIGLIGCKKDDPPKTPATVVDVMSANGFTTLVGLAVAANLGPVLTGVGPFTVFAPSNGAFTGVTPPSGPALSNLLTYHVISGQALTAANVISLSNGNLIKVTMVNADSTFIKASSAGVFVNGIQVTRPNLEAKNGIVHGIDRILFPPTGNIVATAQATPGFDSLVKAVLQVSGAGATGLDNIAAVLSTRNGLTVFAPTNQAFADLFANPLFPFRNISQIPIATLRAVLLHHTVTARAFSNDLANGNIAMANGSNITVAGVGTPNITVDGSGVVFNNVAAGIALTNVMARNGVIHAINKVLIP